MKILVTGGAGFIGSNFVRMALRGDFAEISEVVVLDKLTYAGNVANLDFAVGNPNFEFIQGDICDAEIVSKALIGIDAVLNFAAESHVDRSIIDSSEFIRTNILGVQVLLEASRNSAIKRFLQVSTDEVYGSIETGSWVETEPLLPNSPYAASKASADLIVRSYAHTHKMDVVITRCSNNYGPNQYPEKLIPFFVKQLLSGEKVPIYGDGLNVRDWLHVEDHCRGIALVLSKGVSGEIYNIGGGTELSNFSLALRIVKQLGLDSTYFEYVTDRKGHDRRYSVDWSKIHSLGYLPLVPWETGIIQTIAHYQEKHVDGQ
jgi:dTDP-glucose 4,6-dehydratase